MDSPVKIATPYGEVPLVDLISAYERCKHSAEKKKAWLSTEAGKEYNRRKAKEYYSKHKDKILQKRAKRYETDKDTLLNRAKEYYSLHSEELIEKNRERRLKKKEAEKLNETEA